MLNNLSIGRKLALIALVPFLFFLLFALLSGSGSSGDGDTAVDSSGRATVAVLTGNLYDSVAQEALVNQQAIGVAGIDKSAAMTETDAAITAWVDGVGDLSTIDEESLLTTLNGFADHRSNLGSNASSVLDADMAIIDQITNFEGTLASGAADSAANLRTAADLLTVANTSTELQLLGQWATKDKVVPAGLPAAIAAAQSNAESFQRRTGQDVAATGAFATLVNELETLNINDRVQIDATEWANASNARATVLREVHVAELEAANAAASSSNTASSSGSLLPKLLLPLLALISGLGLAFLFSRNISDSLAELRDEATQVANSDLPRLGDALSTGVPVADLASDREPLDMGDNEFGEVAASLASVRESASAVGERVSALQGGISDTFVNLARRNQSLVDRQLEAIDTLEAEERDADRLSLMYRVDHLATRMRRNAESLLVLADAKAPERYSPAIELREVLRVAIGEVEDYRRIVPISLDDMHVAGPKAQDVAHLLAELMENAAQHSPPGTAVDVTGAYAGSSGDYVITILDHGTGVDAGQLMELNELLQRPPTSTLTISHSIGLQVVSRLAHALGFHVALNHAPDSGIVATVTVPALVVSEWAQTAPAGATTGPAVNAPAPAPMAAPAPALQTLPAAVPMPEPLPELHTAPVAPMPEVAAPVADTSAETFGSFDTTGLDGSAGDAGLGLITPDVPETPTIDMPGLNLPSLGSVPDAPAMPDMAMPAASATQLPQLDVSVEDLSMPGLTDPDFGAADVPAFGAPAADLNVPDLNVPDLNVPDLGAPDVPAFGAPAVDLPEIGAPDVPAFGAPAADLNVADFGTPASFDGAPEAPVFEPAPMPQVATPVPDAPAVFEPVAAADPFAAPAMDTPLAPLEAVPDLPEVTPVPIEPLPADPVLAPVPASADVQTPVAPFPQAPAPMPEPIQQAPAPMPEPVQLAPAPMPAPVLQAPAPMPAPAPALAPVPVAEAAAPVAAPLSSGGLTKRTRTSPADVVEQADLTADRTAPSQRTPDQVKNMLSRYKTGLERGRGPAETDGE